MLNPSFAKLLSEMSKLLELNEENVFKIRAYQNAVQAIENLPTDISLMSRKDLLQVQGIGQGIADKTEEFKATGRVKEHDALRKKFPEGILAILAVPGLGPKRARLLFKELKIDTPEKLKRAAASGQLKGLPGFGQKIEENILKGISFAGTQNKRMLLWEARALVDELIGQLRGATGLKRIEVAGSVRRGKETIGDIDILCASTRPAELTQRFVKLASVERVLAEGKTKSSVLLRDGAQCDLRVVEAKAFGAAMQYFTGSKEHNVALRERAQRMGMTINEYGLFRVSDKKQTRPVALTEEDIYAKLGLQFIPPELRENRGEIEAAEKKRLPKLIEEKDIKGCFHNHTDESDGADTLDDMVAAAKKKGWEWYAVADHSPTLTIARGLEIPRLRKKMDRIKALNKKAGIKVLCSSEVDILAEGQLDYPDDILRELDVVVASVHSGFKQTEEQITGRILKAMENPYVDCVGHLTGRLLGKREAYALSIERIIAGAARTGTALEINGQPDRQDLSDVNAMNARRRGVPLAANTDAHSAKQLNFMSVAVNVARRAWLEKKDIINTMSWPELKDWLEK